MKKNNNFWKYLSYPPLISFFLLLPLCTSSLYVINIFTTIMFLIIVTLSFNLIARTGIFSFAHVGFVAVGAYSSTLLVMRLGLSSWVSFPLAGIISGLLALLIAYPILRIKGVYFFIASYAFAEILLITLSAFDDFFGGVQGIWGIPSLNPISNIKFDTPTSKYYFALILALLVLIFVDRITRTRFGSILSGINENNDLCESIGIDVTKYKVIIFAICSLIAGLGGAFYAHYVMFISPESFGLGMMFNVLVYACLGGLGNHVGAIVGVLFLVLVSEFGRIGMMEPIIYGFVLFIVVIFLPGGLISLPGAIKRIAENN